MPQATMIAGNAAGGKSIRGTAEFATRPGRVLG